MQTELLSVPGHPSPVILDTRLRYIDLDVQVGAGVAVILEGSSDLHEGARAWLDGGVVSLDLPALEDTWTKGWRKITRDIKLSVLVTVPEDSSIRAQFDAGSVATRGRLNNVDIRSNAGSIKIEYADAVAVESEASGISIDTAGVVNASCDAGSRTCGVVDEINASCDAGRIKVDRLRVGDLKTAAGAIRVGDVGEHLSVRADAGSIRVDHLGPASVDAATSLGSIKIAVAEGVPVHVDCKASAGSVRTDLEEAAEPSQGMPSASIRGRTDLGTIRVYRAAKD